jgi:hypothetical protein
MAAVTGRTSGAAVFFARENVNVTVMSSTPV